jgi:hypothetical protein
MIVWCDSNSYLSAHFRTVAIYLLFCQYFEIFVSTDPYGAIYVSRSLHYLWCLQNSIVVHTALDDLVIRI